MKEKTNKQTSNVNNGDKTNSHIFMPHLLYMLSFCICFFFCFSKCHFKSVILAETRCFEGLLILQWILSVCLFIQFCYYFCNKWIMPTPELCIYKFVNGARIRTHAHIRITESSCAHEALTFRYHISRTNLPFSVVVFRHLQLRLENFVYFFLVVTFNSQLTIKLRKRKSAMTTTTTNIA